MSYSLSPRYLVAYSTRNTKTTSKLEKIVGRMKDEDTLRIVSSCFDTCSKKLFGLFDSFLTKKAKIHLWNKLKLDHVIYFPPGTPC